MKKLLSMLLFMTAMIFTLSACSSDDDETDSLSGTEWVTKFADDHYIIIKFTSDSNVDGYFTDTNFVTVGRISSGTYSMKGNQVTFNNFIIKYYGIAGYKYESAQISGSAMTTTYYWKYNTSDDWGSSSTDTFSKR